MTSLHTTIDHPRRRPMAVGMEDAHQLPLQLPEFEDLALSHLRQSQIHNLAQERHETLRIPALAEDRQLEALHPAKQANPVPPQDFGDF